MYTSEFFSKTPKDNRTRFWTKYLQVAKEHDQEFLERHNANLDGLLIFAGLFSAVSSAFIINMESSLRSNSNDTTNALLKLLIRTVDNSTFTNQEVLPTFNGPSSFVIVSQVLAYASLATSLLAAFGAVVGKQW
ncbi:hypothetical protein M422DRAFT_170711, partial [Sphaerobolus stellatus SS14]